MATAVKPHSKRRGWARFLIFLCVTFLSILIGGFIAFAQHVDRIQPPARLPVADGIVVWTGKGGGRLEAGGDLLQAKRGERLLISGVHKDNTSKQIGERMRANGINPQTAQRDYCKSIRNYCCLIRAAGPQTFKRRN